MKKGTHLQKLSNFVIFQTDEGKVNIDVFFAHDTLWLTQKIMGQLFEVDRSVITKHLKNIFDEGELEEKSVSANFAHTAKDAKKYITRFYSLDAIIAVGYRVNSKKATKFRIWATQILQEFIIKGFVLDDERLKQMGHFGKDDKLSLDIRVQPYDGDYPWIHDKIEETRKNPKKQQVVRS